MGEKLRFIRFLLYVESRLVSVYQESLLYAQLERRLCTSNPREAINVIPSGAVAVFQQVLEYSGQR